MLLIYTHTITPRLSYIFKQIFIRVLQIPIEITTKVEEFVAFNGPKITYTKTALGTEFFVRNHALLFEQGITDVSITLSHWDDIPAFFPTGEQSSIPFDIFAASFYLISRYEEYQPYVPDTHERFSANQSLAFQGDFLEKPIVDIWAYKLLDALQKRFPDYPFPQRKYQVISTLNVKETFAYKHKGLIRNSIGFFSDIFRFNFKGFIRRIAVLSGYKKDPNNTFQKILDLAKEAKTEPVFFFLFSKFSTFDMNVSNTNIKHRLLIKSIIDYADFGQLFSYYSMQDIQKLHKEKSFFEDLVNRPVLKSRQHYNRLKIPKTYQNLVDVGIAEDYSMGYYTHAGFRASTCTPFYFYDLDFEIQTPLLIYPFAFNDETFKNSQLSSKESLLRMRILQNEVQKVNGTFITIFHNSSLRDVNENLRRKDLYKQIHSL